MLSILIPTYGYPVVELARELHRQLMASGLAFELICIDNGSGSDTNKTNEEINRLENCSFLALEQDGGRSKIRNRLAAEAKYPWLLFLDADVLPVRSDFIQKYLAVIPEGHKIAFGGLRYQEEKPTDKGVLRWVYGNKREAVPLEKRKMDPVRSFTSANFLISKELLMAHPFDESLVQYGFEDALLAIELARSGIAIHHLDSPVYHLGLETSTVFVEKTKKAVENLWVLYQKGHLEAKDSDLLGWGIKIDRKGLGKIFSALFRMTGSLMERQLTSSHPSMLIYDLYRLGYLSTLPGVSSDNKEP